MINMILKIKEMTKETMEEVKGYALNYINLLSDSEESEEIANYINYEYRQKAIELNH